MSLTAASSAPTERRRSPDRGTVAMLVGTVVNAVGAYLFTMVGGRILGPTDFAPLAVLWTVQFLLMTVLFLPTEQLVIRQLTLGGSVAALRRPLTVIVTTVTLGTGLFALATTGGLFAGQRLYAAAAAGLAAGYALYVIGRGRLAGGRRYGRYGVVTAGEAMLRLLVMGLVLAIGATQLGLATAMVAAPLVALPIALARSRGPADAGLHVAPRGFLSGYVTGNAAAQTLLAAGPLAVAAIGGDAAAVSIITVTMTLFRFPLTMSYNLLARALPPLVRLVEERRLHQARRITLLIVVGGLLLSGLAAAVGYVVGPAAVAVLFGPEFRPDATFSALVAGGALVALTALVIQQVLVALGDTRRLAISWWIGLAVAIAAVWLAPISPIVRVGAAFVAGNCIAFLLLAVDVLARMSTGPVSAA